MTDIASARDDEPMEDASLRRRLSRPSRYIAAHSSAQIIVAVVLPAPLISAGAVAITGRPAAALWGVLGLPSGLFVAWRSHRGGWELTSAQRAMLWDVHWSGRLSGDPHVDRIAAYQLDQSQGAENAGKVFLVVLFIAGILAPIGATLRVGNPWWLLTLLLTAALAVFMAPLLHRDSSAERLRLAGDAARIRCRPVAARLPDRICCGKTLQRLRTLRMRSGRRLEPVHATTTDARPRDR